MARRRTEWLIVAATLLMASCAAPSSQLAPPAVRAADSGPSALTTNRAPRTRHARARSAQPARALPAGVPQDDWPPPVKDNALFGFLLLDQLEYRVHDGATDALRWDAQGWYGGDYHRLWVRSEGDSTTSGSSVTDVETQLLYSRMIAPFWDVQLGLRYDLVSGPGPDLSRWLGVVGFQGFAPYRFDVEPALFVSEDGDVSARLTGTTDWLITQRLIIQPRLETELAAQDVPAFGVGEGLEYLELGLRLRYEIRREFAPYAGVEWQELFGRTADLARAGGEDASALALVFGVRLWR